ncbi:MAG: UDP-N-acetylmuramoyl-tripeptide--D-alanyl-D-alanine ligase [Pseudomonadota bacterium]
MQFCLGDIARVTGGRILSGSEELSFTSIGIDTRKLKRGDLFVAIPGLHFDGHDFIGDAQAAGAAALLMKKGTSAPEGIGAIEVDDTVCALGDIASWWREKFKVPCVAITGSNGKSTTKEMAAAIAHTMGPVLKTEGNFNNLIGLPLTVFRWDDLHRVSILEMGMNAPGEIRRLTQIARPDIGLITNVTAAHLEKLHTVEAVARAKGELFEAMDSRGIAIINAEDRWVRQMASMHAGEKIFFGMQNNCDVKFLHMETNGLDKIDLTLAIRDREYKARLPVPGAHNVMNALAAVAVGVALGVDEGEAVNRLSDFHPMAMRFERMQLANGARVVNDSYNANPESMRAAFRTVGAAKRSGRFIAALGDMLELGDKSGELHQTIGKDAESLGVNELFLLGDYATDVAKGATDSGMSESSVHICEDADQLVRLVEIELKAGDVLLVKGSRGMHMEVLVEHLKKEIGTG